jgi:hypothetical protein
VCCDPRIHKCWQKEDSGGTKRIDKCLKITPGMEGIYIVEPTILKGMQIYFSELGLFK